MSSGSGGSGTTVGYCGRGCVGIRGQIRKGGQSNDASKGDSRGRRQYWKRGILGHYCLVRRRKECEDGEVRGSLERSSAYLSSGPGGVWFTASVGGSRAVRQGKMPRVSPRGSNECMWGSGFPEGPSLTAQGEATCEARAGIGCPPSLQGRGVRFG